jgi:acylphosphatase
MKRRLAKNRLLATINLILEITYLFEMLNKYMNIVAKHIIFSGQVQGVGFRFTALRAAKQCDLVGFVRNLPNGSVEMVVQGQAGDVTNCIEILKKSFEGITSVKIDDVPVDTDRIEFKMTY